MIDRSPGAGRYAHVEREQRWRVASVPAEAERTAEIHDWYIDGTRLRLRRVDGGQRPVFKLAQKVRPDPSDPETVRLTNIYLSPEEFEILRSLPGCEIHKTRWHVLAGDRRLAIDEFHGSLRGLVLAETELEPGEERLPAPSFAIEDVTNDDRFSGGALAFASRDDLDDLLGSSRPGAGDDPRGS